MDKRSMVGAAEISTRGGRLSKFRAGRCRGEQWKGEKKKKGGRGRKKKKKKHTSCWRSVSRMASTPYISIDIYVYTCIEARLSTGSYFPVRQRVVVLVWSSRPVQLLMYSPTRITSSSLAHFSHFKCPLSFIFSLSFPPLLPYSLPPSLPRALARSLARARIRIIYTARFTSLIPFSRSLQPFLSSPPPVHTLLLLLDLFLYIHFIYIYMYV